MELEEKEVSVVIPVLNEEHYISKCLNSVIAQDYPKDKIELMLVDGMSDDATVDIVKKYMQKYSFIRLLENPKRAVQYALNIGIRAASGRYIVRMDAHSEYAENYISKCVEYLEKTGASNVGGPMVAAGVTDIQKAVAAAYHSEFALGGGKNHDRSYEGFADTVYLGSFRRKDIEKLGFYDERLTRNEDDDLSFRMIENGMKIFITPEIKSVYYPRSTYKGLFKQYYEYGLWKVAVIKKHKKPARISHLIPMLFAAFLIIFGLLSLFSRPVSYVFFSVLALYIILDLIFSFRNKFLNTIQSKLSLMIIHTIMHVSYGLGFWAGIFKFWNARW